MTKPKLLIAGHDFKFINDSIVELEKYFSIRFDKWQGHTTHNERESFKCLEWAEYIWCEWLLGNVVWYSRHKRDDQYLVVRNHRMELGFDFGSKMDIDKVDAVIVVSTFFFERLLERYPHIPRGKVRLIPNYVKERGYEKTWHQERLFSLGIIGILPSRKGFKKSLEILCELRANDIRFNLKVFGKTAEELSWVAGNKEEMNYYNECQRYIEMNNLKNSVKFLGHVDDIEKELIKQKVGYILSVSDPESDSPGPESFHLAIADGFVAGAVSLILRWPGSEYIWPKTFLYKNKQDIINELLFLKNDNLELLRKSSIGEQFVKKNYALTQFIDRVRSLFLEVSANS